MCSYVGTDLKMFLQNLSAASERKGRKAGNTTKVKTDDATRESKPSSTSPAASVSGTVGLHTQKDGPIPRHVIEGFLNDCVAKMLEDTTIDEIVRKHLDVQRPLFELMIEYQKEV